MKRMVWLFLLALTLPVTAFAGSVEFTTTSGTLSGSSTGLSLSGSILIADGVITGSDLGTVTFSTAGLKHGNLEHHATFMAGGAFTITGDGMNGVHNGVIFSGTFSQPVIWRRVSLGHGSYEYELVGTVTGTWYTGAKMDGAIVALTLPVGKGWSGRSVTLGSADMNISTIGAVPEPGSLTLLGTGLFGLAGVVRRKLKV